MLLRPLRRDHYKKVYFFISAPLHSLHRDDQKKLLFPLLLIATTFTTSWLCQKNVFPIATTFTTQWSWKKKNVFTSALRLINHDHDKKNTFFSFQHYVHYVLITTENTFIFISTTRSQRDKVSGSIRIVQGTVFSPSGI